jgi:hypothetical protein
MSALVDIKGIRQYLALLNLNTAFEYKLADERDHRLLLVLDVPVRTEPARTATRSNPDDQDEPPPLTPAEIGGFKTIAVNENGISPGIRRRRYLKLGQLLAQSNDDSDMRSFLSAAIANGLLNGALDGNRIDPPATADKLKKHHIVCLEFLPQPLDGLAQVPPAERGLDAHRWQQNTFDQYVYPGKGPWGAWSVTRREGHKQTSGAVPVRPVRSKDASQPAAQGTGG